MLAPSGDPRLAAFAVALIVLAAGCTENSTGSGTSPLGPASNAHSSWTDPTPLGCASCHVVPADSFHAKAPSAQKVVVGTLARTGGAAPIWNDATPLTCASCHAMPPTGHPAYAGIPTAASCFQCHPQSVNADGTIKLGGGGVPPEQGRRAGHAADFTPCIPFGVHRRRGEFVSSASQNLAETCADPAPFTSKLT